jgi:hypothetical protein
MADLYLGKIPIIRRSLNEGWIRGVGDESYGCVPRDYNIDPPEMGDSPAGIDVDIDHAAFYEEQQAQQSSLLHQYLNYDIQNGTPVYENLDQNGQGYCWAYSTGQGLMTNRMARNLPPIRLSPHAVACKIKNFQDQGGWCGLSEKFAREKGYPTVEHWPEKSMNRKYDTPETWANALLHRSDEDWYDLGRPEYDQRLARKQIMTLGVTNCSMMLDFNRFSHSMHGMGAVMFEKNAWGPLCLNSWKGYGYHGLIVLAEIWPDNACAIRSTTPSVN